MWLQVCLNGSRASTEHAAVPLTPAALADDARRVLAAGAVSLHVHSVDKTGVESLAPDVVGATLKAIRETCPGVAVGISTAAYIEPDLSRRLTLIDTWTVLPDFVSVNISEPGIEQIIAVLVRKNVGLEAGIWTAEDARFLLTLTDVPWLRLLLEPWESDPEQANMRVDAIEDVLGDALPQVPRLVHGTDEAVWPLLERAMRSGHVSRIGLEDTLLLPTGEIATDNAALVRAAKALKTPVFRNKLATRNTQLEHETLNSQHVTRNTKLATRNAFIGGTSNMAVDRKQMIDELNIIEDPKLIQEGDFQSDSILRIVSSQGGYRLEIDAFPIDGPFEISSDEYTEMSKLDEEGDDGDGLLDLSEDQLEMVQAGCEPEMPYYRYQMDVRAEGAVFSEDRDELVEMLIEDVMDLVDCQLWDEMKDTELEDWYTWSTYADS